MRKLVVVGVLALVGALLVGALVTGGLLAAIATAGQPHDEAACQPLAGASSGGGGRGAGGGSLSGKQRNNAKVIVDVANKVGAGSFGAQVAIATSLQESHLSNLSGGDRDSVGLFQQRDAWGSFQDRTTPQKSATMFFRGGAGGQPGLLDISGWQQLPATVAAQRVQASAFPAAYAKWTSLAAQLVHQGGGGSVTCNKTGNGHGGSKAAAALKFAMAQRGKPYVWGATGPDSFDCSGLMLAAWRQAGVKLPRVTREQYDAGHHIPAGQAKRGDLLFWSSNGSAGGIHHVAMVLGGGKMIEAQQTGVPVKVSSIRSQGLMPKAVRLAPKT